MGFPTKNDHFGVFWGYHHLRKHPGGGNSNIFGNFHTYLGKMNPFWIICFKWVGLKPPPRLEKGHRNWTIQKWIFWEDFFFDVHLWKFTFSKPPTIYKKDISDFRCFIFTGYFCSRSRGVFWVGFWRYIHNIIGKRRRKFRTSFWHQNDDRQGSVIFCSYLDEWSSFLGTLQRPASVFRVHIVSCPAVLIFNHIEPGC